MTVACDKTPFPWFGGKRDAAPIIWAALGDPEHYVEPFMGGLAVLLCRPALANRSYHSETVNDMDGHLCNAWRAIQLHPDETAEWASWPVSECDLLARHLWLVRWADERNTERLRADPEWCDPRAAGYWLWGICCWIGGGWCSGKGPWRVRADGRIERQSNGRAGVNSQLPHLGSDGMGVNRPQLREPGVSPGTPDHPWEAEDFHPMTMPELRAWFAFLAARLRHVRILCGDWTRAVTGRASKMLQVRSGKGQCGIFLDPPYSLEAGRNMGLYREESGTVAHAVREWCLEHGDDPDYRIVLAGYEGEHPGMVDAGWREVEWFKAGFLKGGMGHQQGRERLWLSPHCLLPVVAAQGDLFGGGR